MIFLSIAGLTLKSLLLYKLRRQFRIIVATKNLLSQWLLKIGY